MDNQPTPKATAVNLDLQLEECVIGALLLEWPTAWPKVHKFLTAASFQGTQNRGLMSAMESLDRDGLPVDLMTVMNRLRASGMYSGDMAYHATGCMSKVASSANIAYHAQLVVQHTMVARAEMELRSAQAGMQVSVDKFDAFLKAQEKILSPLSPAQQKTFMKLMCLLVDENNEHSRAPSHATKTPPSSANPIRKK